MRVGAGASARGGRAGRETRRGRRGVPLGTLAEMCLNLWDHPIWPAGSMGRRRESTRRAYSVRWLGMALIMATLQHLGLVYYSQGKLEEAREAHSKAMEIWLQVRGHPF